MRCRPLVITASIVALSACGGGGDSSAGSTSSVPAASSTSAPGEPSPETTTPGTTTPDDTASGATNTTSDITGDTATETTQDAPRYTGDAGSDWCVAARDVETASSALDDADFADPAAVKAAFEDMIPRMESAVKFAPPELRSDVERSLESIKLLQEALIDVDYDFLNADLSVLDDLDASTQTANDNIDLYNEQVCGMSASQDSSDGGSFDPGAGTIREQTIAELVRQGFTAEEAGCIFDGFDFTDPTFADDMEAIVAVFAACDIDLARLAELGG
jgi:hypothetical protein